IPILLVDSRVLAQSGTTCISGATFTNRPVKYAVDGNLAIFEGDIVLGTVAQVQSYSCGTGESLWQQGALQIQSAIATGGSPNKLVPGSRYRWPRGFIPFEIDPSLGANVQTAILQAIQYWQQATRLQFVQVTAQNATRFPNRIRFVPASD